MIRFDEINEIIFQILKKLIFEKKCVWSGQMVSAALLPFL